MFVADDIAEGVVGFVSGGAEHHTHDLYDGEIYAIYLLETYHRKGIGRLLISALAKRLLDAGIQNMLVWVLAENPYRQFYESLGGVLLKDQDIDIGGAMLKMVSYGWSDINTLIKA